MAVRDLIVLNTTQSRLEPHQGSDTVRLKGGSTELLRVADGSDVAVMTVRSLSPGLNISGSITGSSVSGSETSTGSFYYVEIDGMSGDANQIKDIVTADVVSSSAQLAAAISGSWQGEFSSSAKMFIGGGISGSEESTGSFGRIQATTLIGDASQLTNVITEGTVSRSLATNLTSGSITHNQSLQFNGVDNYIVIDGPVAPAEAADSFTISGWFKTSTAAGSQTIITNDSTATNPDFRIYMNGGSITFYVQANGGNDSIGVAVSTDAWHNFVAVKNAATNFSLYVDGNHIGTTAMPGDGDLDRGDDWLIGERRLTQNSPFKGILDEFGVWTDTITQGAAHALNNNGNPTDLRQPWGIPSGSGTAQYTETGSLVAWWRMGDSHHWSGSTVDGASPSGYITASFEGSRWFIDNVASSSWATGSSVNMSANSASTDVPMNHSESALDFYDQTISNDVTGSWQGVFSGSSGTTLRSSGPSVGGISGSGTQAGNLLVHSRFSGSATSTGSFDKVHIDYMSGDGTLVTSIQPAGVISSSVSTNLTSSGIIQNINKNYSFSGSDGVDSRLSPRFSVTHDNQQAGQTIEGKNFTISYWDFPWGFKHNNTIIRKESAYTLEQYVSANTFHNRYEFRVGVGNTTYALSGSYSGSYWHNIVFVRDGTNAKLYMQGELACTVPVGSSDLDDETDILSLMAFNNGGYSSPSAFGGYAMWDQGLSGSEVRSIYNHGEPTDLNHTWNDYSQTGSLIMWLNPASSSFDSTATKVGVSPDGTWTIADSSVRNNMFATSSGMNESSRSDHHPIGHILGTQDPTFNSDVSGSFTGFLSSSTAVTTSVRFSGSFTSTGSFDALHADFLEGDGSELTGIQPDGAISSSGQLSGISGSWRPVLSGSEQLIMSSSFSGSAASTGSFDVLYADILRGDASEVTGLHVPSGALSRSYQVTGEGSALSSLTSGSWSDVSSSLANRYVDSASGAVNQTVRSGSSVSFSEVNVTDTIFYRELIVSSSDSSYSGSFASGSTAYGDDSADTHEVTGSISLRLPMVDQYAFQFDGSDDYIDLGSQDGELRLSGSNGTISAWINCANISSGDYKRIVDKSDGGSSANGYGFILHTDGKIMCYHDSVNIINSDTALSSNRWYHIVWKWDGVNHKIFINGLEDKSVASTSKPPSDTTNMMIGRWNHSALRYFDGLMANVGIWNTGLSASAATALWNDGNPIDLNTAQGSYQQTGSLVSWWRMGESASYDGSIWTIPDSAATGLNNFGTSSGVTRVPTSPTISSSLGAGDGKTFFTVRGNISGSAQSSGSFGSLFGSGDGLSGLTYTASRVDQSVWKGETNSFNIPTGSTAERAVITGSAPQYVSASGMMRFNSTDNNFEGWDGRNWITLAEGSVNSTPTTELSGSFTVSGSIPGQRGLFVPNGLSIEMITISSLGDAVSFGNKTTDAAQGFGLSNGILGRGIIGNSSNVIDMVDINTPGNAVDFGDGLAGAYYYAAALSNGPKGRGITAVGRPSVSNVISYITIGTAGDAVDFGDVTRLHGQNAAGGDNGSDDRGLIMGGHTSPKTTVMDYITISTPGNSSIFGDLTKGDSYSAATSNSTNNRIIYKRGYYSPYMEYITTSTLGDATVFDGKVPTSAHVPSVVSNGIDERAVHEDGVASTRALTYWTINTQGNAQAFGNLTENAGQSNRSNITNSGT